MFYNKREFDKTNDKKVMRKVKKQWVIVSLATFMFVGGSYSLTNNNVLASDNVTSNQTTTKTDPNSTSDNSQSKASDDLHTQTSTTSANEQPVVTTGQSDLHSTANSQANQIPSSSTTSQSSTQSTAVKAEKESAAPAAVSSAQPQQITLRSDNPEEQTSQPAQGNQTNETVDPNGQKEIVQNDTNPQAQAANIQITKNNDSKESLSENTSNPNQVYVTDFLRTGLKGEFTVSGSELKKGNTITLGYVSIEKDANGAFTNIYKQGSDIDVFNDKNINYGKIQYDGGNGIGGKILFKVADNIQEPSDPNQQSQFNFSSSWFFTINIVNKNIQANNYGNTPFTNEIKINDVKKPNQVTSHAYPIKFTKPNIKLINAEFVEPDGLNADRTVGAQDSSVILREYLNHTVITNNDVLKQLQDSHGQTGNVDLTSPVISYERIKADQPFTISKGIAGIVTLYVDPSSNQIQADNTYSFKNTHYGDEYAKQFELTVNNAGDGLTLDQLKTKAQQTGLYYSKQDDGSVLVIKYISKDQLNLNADEIKEGVSSDRFSIMDDSKNSEASKNATVDFYKNAIKNNGGAGQVQTGTILTFSDNTILSTATVDQLDSNGNVIKTAQTTTLPNKSNGEGNSAVQVNFVDEDGNIIAKSQIKWGWNTDRLTISPANVPGYSLDTTATQLPSSIVTAGSIEVATSDKSVTYPGDGQTKNYYYVYKANTQTAKVNYYDEDNHNSLITSADISGKTGSKSSYRTTAEIISLEKQGYILSKDNYPANGYVFTSAENQTISVYLKHGTKTFTPNVPGTPGQPLDPNGNHNYPATDDAKTTKSVTRMINYKYAKDQSQAAPSATQTVTFGREVTFDLVTGKITNTTPWTSANATFAEVTSPAITGYTADKAKVEAQAVTADTANENVDVFYNADAKAVDIQYLDQDDNMAVIKTDHVAGKFGETANYSTTNEINKLKAEGYELVKDNYPTNGYVFANENNTITVILKHKQKGTPETPKTPEKPVTPEVPETPKSPAEPVSPKETTTSNQQETPKAKQTNGSTETPVKTLVETKGIKTEKSEEVKKADNSNAKKTLPQTGQTNNSILGLIGLVLVSLFGLLGFKGIKNKK